MQLPLVLNSFYRLMAQNTPEIIKPKLRGLYNGVNKIATYGFKNRDIFTAIDFEINSQCNLKCSYCPTSFDGGRGVNYMPEEVFRKAVDDLSAIKYSGRLSPHFFGEPLMDKRLPELMAYAHAKLPHAQIVIHTNGILLNYEMYKKLVDSGVSGFLVTQHTKNFPKSFTSIIKNNPETQNVIKVRNLEGLALFNRAGTVKPPIARKMKSCHYVSDEISITYTGEVVCTNDFHVKHSFGNVLNNNLLDIWGSEWFKQIRKEVRKGKFTLDMCRKCALHEE